MSSAYLGRILEAMRGGMVFCLAGILFAEAAPDPTGVLAHARDAVAVRRASLPNYTCMQTVNRSYFGRLVQPKPAPSCSQMHVDNESHRYSLLLYLTDRLRLDVKVSGSQEIGSWAGTTQFDSKSIFDLVGRGPFGTGALGTFLSDIFAGGARFSYNGETLADGGTLYQYSFQVPRGASHYMVEAGRDWHVIAYEGDVGIDPHNYDLRHLVVRADDLPIESETCETETVVDYARVRMSTGEFLLPQQSRLHLVMSDSRESDTATSYSECREYQSESTISFGDAPAASEDARKAAATPVAVPAGLSITLSLETPIDTDTAAGGDMVIEKVVKPVHAKGSKQILIPAGATVRGRIIQMRHWTMSPEKFDIAIRLENWEAGGVASPIFAQPVRESLELPPEGQHGSIETLVIRTSRPRYVVPRGSESKWVTVEAPRAH